MKNKILLWLLAFLITAATAVYQRITGPTYPIKGSIEFADNKISYRFIRSEDVGKELSVIVECADSALDAFVIWKRFKSRDDWKIEKMTYSEGLFLSTLPSQPAAGKLEYYVEFKTGIDSIRIPDDESVIARFKGSVPLYVLILHVVAMFGAMFLSMRTGLEYFNKNPDVKNLTLWTIGFLFAGGLILGPIVQKFAFDAYWTGWPFGTDMTDNKTAVALAGWIFAFIKYRKSNRPQLWALFAAILLLVVYLIPHSVFGSEIDYTKVE